MDTPVEAGEIFRACGPAYRAEHGHEMPLRQIRAMQAVETCRTAALGGHVERCEACGNIRVTYNSCRNRHCPKCQQLDKQRWVDARLADLLPIAYYHVVFTIPAELRPLALRNQEVVYGILYYLKQAYATDDLNFAGEIAELEDPAVFRRLLSRLYEKPWNVYCKRPFGSAERVVKYFARYSHRVAISNERILSFDGDTVVLALSASEGKDRRKVLKLSASEFIRRYLFHVLPDRFVKIRYYGILGNNHRVERLEFCRRLLGCRRPRKRRDRTIKRDWRDVLLELTGIDLRVCPVCGGRMVGRQVFGPQRVCRLPP